MKNILSTLLAAGSIYCLSFMTIADAGCSRKIDCRLIDEGTEKAEVIDIIRELAPSYGVPTWFALRIADVESNYDRWARGQAGEYGIYQLKCTTAEQVGFKGECEALLNPWTNVRFGLNHLSKAIKRSRGDLRLAASKHNGGLARKTLVVAYVDKVF